MLLKKELLESIGTRSGHKASLTEVPALSFFFDLSKPNGNISSYTIVVLLEGKPYEPMALSYVEQKCVQN